MSDSKVYDEEETREEQAKRLTGKRVQELAEAYKKLRHRLRLYSRDLTPADRQALAGFLVREHEATLASIMDHEDETPGFSFPSDVEW